MAQMVGCKDLGVDCEFKSEINEADVDTTVRQTIEHAKVAHPELHEQMDQVDLALRAKIADLMRQSKYHQQTT